MWAFAFMVVGVAWAIAWATVWIVKIESKNKMIGSKTEVKNEKQM